MKEKNKEKTPKASVKKESIPLMENIIISPKNKNMNINITAVFTNGTGTLGIKVFQNGTGLLIEHGALNNSGTVTLINANPGDVIGVDGVCSGNTKIDIDAPTTPATTQHFSPGPIHFGFIINLK